MSQAAKEASAISVESVPALIEAAFAAMPSQAAAEFCGLELTRRELADRSDRLACRLVRQGVSTGSLVGIYMDRSLEMLVAMLGVMKAGAAYVPLDPMFPAARIGQILEETDVSVMITLSRHVEELPRLRANAIALDSQLPVLGDRAEVELPAIETDSRAYVIFTSGSTGRPKGVEVTHGSVVTLLTDLTQRLEMEPQDRLLAVTTLSFDIAVLEMLLPLVSGGTVVIAHRDDVADSLRIMELLQATRANVMQATPITWRMLVENGFQPQPGFKMLCGGEAWTPELANKLLGDDGQPKGRLWNMYGPTETTVWSSVTEMKPGAKRITIGPPIANTRFYVVDERRQPVSPGASGELFIAGSGVARGYFHQPDLTAEKFLIDPFVPSQRMYRTGDEVRLLENGHMEFVGRMDQQVKLRGFRIELGEVETALRSISGVRDAVAVLRHDVNGDAVLAAYYTGDGQRTPTALRQVLGAQLPWYMVPAILQPLSTLPLTPNGKVDRRALPDIREVPGQEEKLTTPIGSEPETDLLRIWRHLFQTDDLNRDSNFFDLGGHSLLLARLQILVKKTFKVQLTVADVFRHPTVAGLTSWLKQAKHAGIGSRPSTLNPRVIPIQPFGEGRPVFVTSQSMIFRTLAAELGLSQPLYALQMLDEDVSSASESTSFHDLAAFYVRLIQEVQPRGPYRLAGWCVSGWIAYEVGRQLEMKGEEIELLMVMDAWAPAYWSKQPRIRRLMMQIVDGAYRFRWLFRRLRGSTMAERGAYFRASIRGMIVAAGGNSTQEMRPSEQLEYAASQPYAGGSLQGNVLLFRSEQQPTGPLLAADMGWSDVVGRPIEAQVLPGGHHQIFDLPGARMMAVSASKILGIPLPASAPLDGSSNPLRQKQEMRSVPAWKA